MPQESFTKVSERLRKYLIEIYFLKTKYFTVFGSDIQEHEMDKLLINSDKQVMLFSRKNDLIRFLNQSKTLFDRENFDQWKSFLISNSKTYREIDLDSFILLNNGLKNSESIFIALGLIEDFAIQTQEETLLNYFGKKSIKKFKDDAADLFIWSRKITIEADTNLSKDLNEIYERLSLLTYRN